MTLSPPPSPEMRLFEAMESFAERNAEVLLAIAKGPTMRAKFQCIRVENGDVALVAMRDEVNKQWGGSPPIGRLDIMIESPEALEKFKVDRHYFLSIHEVVPPSESAKAPEATAE